MRKLLISCAALALCGLSWALDEDVAGWIKDLASTDQKTREAAAENLEKAGERAREALEAATKSEDPEVASEASDILKRLQSGPRKNEAPKPKRRVGTAMSSMRIILNGQGSQTSIQEDSGGRVVVKETRDGKTAEFAAESREAFTEKYPEVAKKYGLDKEGGGLSLGSGKDTPEDQALEKRVEELQREIEERIRKRQGGKDLDKEEDDLRRALEEQAKKEKGQPVRVELGAEVGPVDDALRYQLDIPEGGVLIESVDKGSRAERLGLRQYDILLTLNGKPVSTAPDIRAALAAEGPATAEIVREGDREALREKE
ncbi:MAG: putative periplasmic serine [Planctomycetota bacterium]|nr:MAG: putative periplasmic serine [Planctomycetota bacterium]